MPAGSAIVNPNCHVAQPRSIEGATPSHIDFVNASGVAVDIYWLDYEGDRVHYATVAPGGNLAQPTWLTHPWIAVDKAGNCLGYTISESLSQTYTILPLELPGNGRLFFLRSSSLADLDHDIYSVRPDGGGLTGVITGPTTDNLLAVSPDGSRAIYASRPLGAPASDAELYLAGAGDPVRLTDNDDLDTSPAWSPDGRSIAFASDRGGTPGIYLMDVATREVTPLFQDESAAGTPSFSPGGDSLAFQHCVVESPCRIMTIRLDGTGLRALTNGEQSDTDPDWGVHGKIVFVRAGGGIDQHELWTVDPAGETPVLAQLTSDGAYNADPAWSPDGTQVAYVTTRFGNSDFDLATISAEGGAPVQVVAGGRNGFPDWQPVPSISSPVAGTTVSGTVTVSASPGDVHPITEIQFFYTDDTGTHSIADDTEPPFEASLDTSLLVGDGAIITARGSTNEGAEYVNSIEVDLDRVAPETSIGGGPGETTTDTVATFDVTANEDATFVCELDDEPVDDCGGLEFLAGLGLGAHTFTAQATDGSGNVDATPAGRTWTVLAPPAPDTRGRTAIASLSDSGVQVNGGASQFPSLADDGDLVGFESAALNLTPLGSLELVQAYVRDRGAGTTTLVSMGIPNPDGVQPGNANSGWVQVAGNGASAVFQSLASNLACTDVCLTTTSTWHVYSRSLGGASTQFVDTRGNTIANGSSQHPSVSANGQYVAFDTAATNLLPESADTNGNFDIYVRNLDTATPERVSVSSSGEQANGDSFYPAISGDGRFVAFASEASNLVAGDDNDATDIFVHDRETGETTLVSVTSSGAQANGNSSAAWPPSISADGSRIAFLSRARNLAPGLSIESPEHLFVRDRAAGTTQIADLSGTGERGNAPASAPAISDDGLVVSFTSAASNLSPLTGEGGIHVYVRDLAAGTTRVVDLNPAGAPGNGSSHNGLLSALSADGRYAAFSSAADDLLGPGKDVNAAIDVFVRDLDPFVPPTAITATLTTDAESTEAGAKQLPIDNFPLSILQPDPGAAVAPAPIDNFPIDNFPIDNFPIDNFPIDNFPIDNFPIDNFPIDNFAFDSPTVARELDDVPLSTIGIAYAGGWPKVLEGSQYDGVPPQGVSLAQLVLASPPSPALTPASGTPQLLFEQLDFSSSKLRRLGFEALAVGAVPLSQINPLGGGDALTDWCTALSGPPINCTTANQAQTIGSQTVLGAALTGAPIDNFPIDNFPIDNFPIDNFPIDNMPIDNFPIDNMPLSVSPIDNFPIDNFDLAASGFGALPLRQILAATLPSPSGGQPQPSPLGSIRIVDLASPTDVVSATTEATLGAAFAAGHVQQTATLSDLAGSLDGFTLGDLLFYGDPPLTVGNLLDGLPTPTGLTFNDLLALFITRAGVPWETISADVLGRFGTNGGLTWRAGFTLEGPEGAEGEATVAVTLPSGWRYAAGTSSLHHGESTTELEDPTVSADGRTLTWTVAEVALGEDYRIDFDAFAGIDLGPTSASLSVSALGTELEGTDTHSVVVRTVFEPNDDPATAPIVEPNVEVDLSYVDAAGDTDFYRIPTPPAGWRLNVHMTNLDADYDLTLYAPATAPPLVDTGTVGVPLQDPPISDDGVGLSDLGRQLEPGALQDIPIVDLPIAAQSIFRGNDPEDVSAISLGGGGYYVLQVSGYNDASSQRPYTLRVTSLAPRAIGPCAPRSFPHATEGTAGAQAAIPANVNTLFLVNKLRLGRTYGAGPADDVLASLATVAGQSTLGVAGAVVPVEAYGDNAARYDAWDANPCAPELANAVASGIAATVNSIRLTHPSLKYVVFVGGDDQIPFFRVPDLTLIANESGEAATFEANQYYGAFIRENLLSDDPYLDTDPIQAGARQIFVPDLAGGRLVETPGQIIGQLEEFVAASGMLARDSAFSAGYDFASDGTEAASDELAGIVGATSTRTLIDDTWDRVGLLGALFPGGGASGINQLNGHYDHYRALPAAGNTAQDTSDMLTTADLDARPGTLPRRILFTIGCHAGLPVSNVVVGETSPIKRDWAEAYADQRSAYAANTGFGLGSTDSVAWSEQLMTQLAGHLDGSLTIGEALAQAKADYFLDRSSFSAYEQKTTLQATLYGLPFFGVGVTPAPVGTPPSPVPTAPVVVPGTTSATAPSEGPIVTDPVSGLASAEFGVVPVFTLENGAFGDFWTNAGRVTATHYRPLVSALSLPATRTGVRAHSALIESLVSQDDSPWDPSLQMPTTDATTLSPEPTFTDVGFPSGIPVMATARSVTGTRSQLNLATSQYFTDDTPGSEGASVMRRWTEIEGRVFYNTSTDYEPPIIRSSEATRFGSNVGFEVTACSAVRVYILFDDLGDTSGTQDAWVGVDLVPDAPGSCRFTGGAPVIGPNVQYIVQACDADGNCAMSTNKAHYFQAQQEPPEPPAGITIALTGTQAAGLPDYFSSAVQVDVTPSDGAAVTIDGRTPASLPATVTTDGLHVVEVDTATGGHAEKRFVIDATAPRVVISSPPVDTVLTLGESLDAAFTCLDSGSGVRSCVGSTANGSPLPTGTIGEHTLTVTATDIVGHVTTATRTYRVIWPFTGFFAPVDNPPVVNLVKAGTSVPIKFGLGGNRGLDIFAAGSPSSLRVSCNSSQPETALEQIDAPGASGLSYDTATERYHYVWKTNKSWAGTCRQLVVTLVDGTSHQANFRFK